MTEDTITRVRIFISSPGDVRPERDIVVRMVERLNAVRSIAEKYRLETVSYERDATPIVGKEAQIAIDETMGEAKDCYLVVLLLWSRIGQPFTHPRTHIAYESGTYYEVSTAYASFRERGTPRILVYRKTAPYPDMSDIPAQEERVEAFFQGFRGDQPQYRGLYKCFTSPAEFEDMIFRDIQNVLEHYPPQPPSLVKTSSLETIQSKRARLATLRQSGTPTTTALTLEIRKELRQTLSPMPAQRYARFIGRREKIDAVLRQLDDEGAHSVIAINGIGGAGKTALAYEVARRALDANLVEAVVWESDKPDEFVGSAVAIKAAELDLENLLNNIGRKLGYFDVVNMAQAQKVAYLQRALNERDRFLIVVDNLDTIKGYHEVTQIIGQLASLTKVVLTSRYKVEQMNTFTVDLQGLERDEGLEFLREEGIARGDAGRAVVNASDGVLGAIWAATEGMPLAMKLIVGQIGRTSPASVLRRLENFRGIGVSQRAGVNVFDEFYQYIYHDTWEQLSETAQVVIACLSSYDPVEGARYSSLLQTGQEDIGLSVDDIENALAELIDFSLVTVMDEPGEQRYILHPLTRNYVRSMARE